MKTFLTLILAAAFGAATSFGQTIKTLGYNTTNGQVIYSGTNTLTFTNANLNIGDFNFNAGLLSAYGVTFDFEERQIEDANVGNVISWSSGETLNVGFPIDFGTNAATTRTNLGLGATWLTNTNVTNFRTAIGLGATNAVGFGSVSANFMVLGGSVQNPNTAFIVDDGEMDEVHYSLGGMLHYSQHDFMSQIDVMNRSFWAAGNVNWTFYNPITFNNTTNAATTRTNLGLGATNSVAFRNITSDGNIVISNQSATNNALLFVYRTNNEPFLGLANLIASNNTTISNETLFRVGVAEATNRSAQFGFRSTNTNGNGVAVFSVFGFDALMMIGADASTNAVIYSGGGTNNEVMTLIRDGATEFARPIRFSTNASTRPETNAPANTTNVAAWVEIRIGTNSYRVPLYQ
jgi:hypothetical protein